MSDLAQAEPQAADDPGPVFVNFTGGPLRSWNLEWDAPVPQVVHAVLVRGSWLVVWEGGEEPALAAHARRQRYELAASDAWSATYRYTGPLPALEPAPEVPPTNRRREVPR